MRGIRVTTCLPAGCLPAGWLFAALLFAAWLFAAWLFAVVAVVAGAPALAQAPEGAVGPAAPQAGGQRTGESTGLVLPRFASVRAGEAKLRTGPGLRYPAEWLYRFRDMPVEIIAEYEAWRKVRDWEGTEGWMHQSLLSGQRTAIVMAEETTLRRAAAETAAGVARLHRGVVARLERCEAGWCAVTAGGYQGWLPRTAVYGVFADEAFGE